MNPVLPLADALLAALERDVDAQASDGRAADLFNSAPDAYLVTDADGVILDANRAACELLGVAVLRVTGKPLATFFAGPHRKEFRRRLCRLVAGGRDASTDWRSTVSARHAAEAQVEVRARACGDAARDGISWLLRPV